MKIYGLQKMTLLDYPGKVACTVFTGGCDFRCPFCHNFELVDGSAPPVMEISELMDFLKTRTTLLEGVAITGGEPCINRDLPDLLSEIKSLDFPVKLDTNGNNPDMLRFLIDEGLVDYVAMDIKNSPGKYAETIGLRSQKREESVADMTAARRAAVGVQDESERGNGVLLDNIKESIEILIEGRVEYEFRTTVIAEFHDADDMHEIGEMIKGAKKHFLQPFTDRDTVPYEGFHAPAGEEVLRYRDIIAEYVEEAFVRGA